MGVRDTAERLVERLVAAAHIDGVGTGFVHVDSIPDPYTELITSQSRLSDDQFLSEVHGYYWVVVLTAGHIERLGGRERIRRKAPCVSVQPLATAQGEALLCRLTDDPLLAGAREYLEWREFLRPVLRPGYPSGREGIGYYNMAAPCWIFEGEPTLEITRFILSRGDSPQRELIPVVRESRVNDPERPSIWIYPADGFVPDQHEGVTAASVRAWCLAASTGQLAGVDVRARGFSGINWERDDQGNAAMVLQIELEEFDRSLDRLSALLTALSDALSEPDAGGLFARVVVA